MRFACIDTSDVTNESLLHSGLCAVGDGEPAECDGEIGGVDVREVAQRRRWDGVEVAGHGEEHREGSGGSEEDGADGEASLLAAMEEESDGDHAVGGEEGVDGEGAHPAVDVSAGGVVEGEARGRQEGEDGGQDAGGGWGFVRGAGAGEAFVGEAVVCHE